jgi:hypothetical protein
MKLVLMFAILAMACTAYSADDARVPVKTLPVVRHPSHTAATVVSFKTQPRKVAAGSTVPGRELILTIKNNSKRTIRSVFANVSYDRSDNVKTTHNNVRVYWAYDNEPGIAPGKSATCTKGRGAGYGDFMGPHNFKVEITEVSDKWMLQSTLPSPPITVVPVPDGKSDE